MGHVIVHNSNWVTQIVHAFSTDAVSDTKTYRRERNNGSWTSWERIWHTESELNLNYLGLTDNQITNLPVTTSTDNTLRKTTTFLTISSVDLNVNTKTITLKVTRDQNHANDTYGGTYHLVSLTAKQ